MTLTCPSYGRVGEEGAPADPDTYDYQHAARDALHFAALFDRFIQNLRRFTGYDLQYFAAIEPQRRLAPHVHLAIRGTISRAELREVIAAAYHQVWWPSTEVAIYDGGQMPVWDEHTGTYLDPDTGEILPTWDQALDAIGGTATSRGRSWLDFCLSYVDMKWPSAAPKTRDALIDALALIILVAVGEEAPEGTDRRMLRAALRHFALAPASRGLDRPPAASAALRWLGKASLPVSEIGKPQHARAVLDAISVTQDGRAASATTRARKRSVFASVIRYAVELEVLRSNPLDRLSWKPPKVSEAVDRRVVVNPRQARELLTAVTYVGQQRRGPHARGQRLMALYACMYFAALRPGEAVALRRQDCYLPATGWGRLTLEKSRPEVNRRWTDTASAHDERGLKHRPAHETRRVPIPPELVVILRQHIDTFDIAADGRIFSSDRGHPVASTAISDVWAAARDLALTPAQVASNLAGRPYDLRHAAVSLWLSAGVPPPRVAERAGHSVEVPLRVYAKCLDDGEDVANTRIDAALRGA